MDSQQDELEATKERIASLEASLQSTKDATSKREEELVLLNAQLKDEVTRMEKELYASNVNLGWFEYKLGKIEHQLGEANLRVLIFEERVCSLGVEAEF